MLCGERFAAAACSLCVRVDKNKLRAQPVFLPVQPRAQNVHQGVWLDQNLDALFFNQLIEFALCIGVVERVAHAAATARLDA